MATVRNSISFSGSRIRRKTNKDVSVSDLEGALLEWFDMEKGTRDINEMMADLWHKQSQNGSPNYDAMKSTINLYLCLFKVLSSGKIPGPNLQLAVTNLHSENNPVHQSKQPLHKVAARFVDMAIRGARGYTTMKDDTRVLHKFLQKASADNLPKIKSIMLLLEDNVRRIGRCTTKAKPNEIVSDCFSGTNRFLWFRTCQT